MFQTTLFAASQALHKSNRTNMHATAMHVITVQLQQQCTKFHRLAFLSFWPKLFYQSCIIFFRRWVANLQRGRHIAFTHSSAGSRRSWLLGRNVGPKATPAASRGEGGAALKQAEGGAVVFALGRTIRRPTKLPGRWRWRWRREVDRGGRLELQQL